MQKSVKSRAEEQFAAIQKKSTQALTEREDAQREISERMARQRALRLAKEASDKRVAEAAARDKAALKKTKTSHLPRAHRG